MRLPRILPIAACVLALVFSRNLHGQAVWAGGNSGTWNVGSNWSTGAPPGSGTNVQINSGTANLPSGVSGTGAIFFIGSSGAGAISVSGGTLATGGNIYTGYNAAGTLLLNGGMVSTGSEAYIGYSFGVNGSATVSSGTWTNPDYLYVGEFGNGSLTINGTDAVVSTGTGIILGDKAGSSGTMTVTSGSALIHTSLLVGSAGTGQLLVNGGVVSGSVTQIGLNTTGVGSAAVSSGSWVNTGGVSVGYLGTGTLAINGGYASFASTEVGSLNTGTGVLTVSSGTIVVAVTGLNGGDFTIGNGGKGAVTVSGGVLSTVSNTVVGRSSGGYGNILVTGGTFSVAGLSLGQSGSASMTVNGGYASATSTGMQGNNTSLTITSGTFVAGDILMFGAATGTDTVLLNGGYFTTLGGASLSSATGLKSFASVTSGTWDTGNGGIVVGADSGQNIISQSGGYITGAFAGIGRYSNSNGTGTMTGGTWNSTGTFAVGIQGNGNLTLNGGVVTGSLAIIGQSQGSSGSVTINSGSWLSTGSMTIGGTGTGYLTITGNGYVSDTSVVMGTGTTGSPFTAGTGTATVTGGTWTTSGSIVVGRLGVGTINLSGSGVINVDTIMLANRSISTGILNISGGTLNANVITTGTGSGTVNLLPLSGSTIIIGSRITGPTPVNMSGTGGTVIFTGSSTTTGTLTISAGTLQLGMSGSGGSLNGTPIVVNNGGTFREDGAGSLGGNTRLTINAGSTVVLSGSNTYTGSTFINTGGLLTLDFSAAGAPVNFSNGVNLSALTVQNGAVTVVGSSSPVSNSAAYASTFFAGGNSNIGVNRNGATGVALSLGVIGRATGATADFELPSGAQSASNGITTSGTYFSSNGMLTGSAYTAFATVNNGADWAALGTPSGGVANIIPLAQVAGGYTATSGSPVTDFSGTGSNMDITQSETAPLNFNGAGAVNSLRFNTDGVTLGLQGTGNQLNSGGILVTKNVVGGAAITGGTLLPGAGNELVVINNGKLTINSSIAGASTSLTVAGAGTTALGGANTYGGGTVLNAGTLDINAGGALGTGTFFYNGGALDNTSGTAVTLSNNPVVVSGSIVFLGSIPLNMGSGTVNYTGTSGLLVVDVGGNAPLTLNGPIQTSSLVKRGAGTLVLGGVSNFQQLTTVESGTLQLNEPQSGSVLYPYLPFALGSGTTGGGTLVVMGTGTGAQSQQVVYLNLYSGANGIKLDPNGGTGASAIIYFAWTRLAGATLNVDLSKNNTSLYSANVPPTLTNGILSYTTVTDSTGTGFATEVSGSTVRYTSASTLASSGNSGTTNYATTGTQGFTASQSLNSLAINSGTGGSLALNGKTMTLTTGAMLMTGTGDYAIGGGLVTGSTGELIVHQYGTGSLVISATTGVNTITKTGGGTLVLNGVNTGTSTITYLNAGTLAINNSAAIGSGTLVIDGGNIDNTSGTAVNLTGAAELWETDFSAGSGTAVINVKASSVNLSGVGNIRTVTVNASSVLSVYSPISGDGMSLNKAGAGTLNLLGTNSYTGNTTVSAGTLSVSGSVSSLVVNGGMLNGSGTTGNVTVNNGGTLGGNLHSGTVTVNAGGALSPGNSPGTSTATNVAISGSASYIAQVVVPGGGNWAGAHPVAGTDYDTTVVTGASNGVAETVLTLDGTPATGSILQLNITGLLPPGGIATNANPYNPNGANTSLDNYFIFNLTDSVDTTSGKFARVTMDGVNFVNIDYSAGNGFGGVNGIGTFTLNGQEWAISYLGDAGSNATSGGNDIALTAISVPEPSTWALMALGVFVAAGRTMQKRLRLRQKEV